jgi:hypothetical protein
MRTRLDRRAAVLSQCEIHEPPIETSESNKKCPDTVRPLRAAVCQRSKTPRRPHTNDLPIRQPFDYDTSSRCKRREPVYVSPQQ